LAEVGRRVKDLDVTHVLSCEIPGHGFGNQAKVLVFAHVLVLPGPNLEEVAKIAILESQLERGHVRHCRITTVLLDQLPEGRRRNGAFPVQVQLDFRNLLEPVHCIRRSNWRAASRRQFGSASIDRVEVPKPFQAKTRHPRYDPGRSRSSIWVIVG